MLDCTKLKTKIAPLVIAALLGLVSLVTFSAFHLKRDSLDGRKQVIQSALEETPVATAETAEDPDKIARELTLLVSRFRC